MLDAAACMYVFCNPALDVRVSSNMDRLEFSILKPGHVFHFVTALYPVEWLLAPQHSKNLTEEQSKKGLKLSLYYFVVDMQHASSREKASITSCLGRIPCLSTSEAFSQVIYRGTSISTDIS